MSDYFPLEVIIEILQKLPVKSLMRFMCVCKAWKSIITNDSFIISHHQHFQTNHLNHSLFLHCQHDDDIYDDGDDDNAISTQQKGDFYTLYGDDDAKGTLGNFKFPPVSTSSHASDKWTVYGTCNGLVCFTERSSSDSEYAQAVIWNPSILKYLILPKPSLAEDFYGLGFDSLNQDFKVVRFAPPNGTGLTEISFQIEIFSLTAYSWRSITVAALPFKIAGIQNKFVNGALHWLAYRKINGMNHYFILTFDFVEEKFGEVMLPHCLKEEESNYVWSILTGGNLLAVNHSSVYAQSICDIWVMKEYGIVESWTQLFRFDSTSDDDMEGVLALWNNNEVVIEYMDQFESCNFLVSCVGDHMESLFLINEKNAKSYLPV